MFNRTAPEDLSKLEPLIKRADWPEAGKVAHHLKSSCYAIGASAMAELCAQLERSAKTGDVQGAPAMYSSLRAAYDQVRAELIKVSDSAAA